MAVEPLVPVPPVEVDPLVPIPPVDVPLVPPVLPWPRNVVFVSVVVLFVPPQPELLASPVPPTFGSVSLLLQATRLIIPMALKSIPNFFIGILLLLRVHAMEDPERY